MYFCSSSYFPSFFFFFLMIRRPPRSTLFPYRRSSDLAAKGQYLLRSDLDALVCWARRILRANFARQVRSEEHTSELQSLAYLVCRLLLEKKKKIQLRNFLENHM